MTRGLHLPSDRTNAEIVAKAVSAIVEASHPRKVILFGSLTAYSLREYGDVPGLIYREALRTGRVVYEPAA